eukprot:6183713-Pleurochrysis_carterae.AAC.2
MPILPVSAELKLSLLRWRSLEDAKEVIYENCGLLLGQGAHLRNRCNKSRQHVKNRQGVLTVNLAPFGAVTVLWSTLTM